MLHAVTSIPRVTKKERTGNSCSSIFQVQTLLKPGHYSRNQYVPDPLNSLFCARDPARDYLIDLWPPCAVLPCEVCLWGQWIISRSSGPNRSQSMGGEKFCSLGKGGRLKESEGGAWLRNT
ncbi:hypothetical protein CEXT_493351 [Caerostris extrusa]|uniref:Uncharacterized protein n=1 Tax=Caerostris extrusa TaxID=172846 RepID=A0AAV4XWE8_CAEEX|nr:hypothetical protein CEXT_493351 [Caerostris extrusa]